MSENLFSPYPSWFEKYGKPETLERFPHGEYLRMRCVDNIVLYNKLIRGRVKVICPNCKWAYITQHPHKGKCPFCSAPKDYNINKIKW